MQVIWYVRIRKPQEITQAILYVVSILYFPNTLNRTRYEEPVYYVTLHFSKYVHVHLFNFFWWKAMQNVHSNHIWSFFLDIAFRAFQSYFNDVLFDRLIANYKDS